MLSIMNPPAINTVRAPHQYEILASACYSEYNPPFDRGQLVAIQRSDGTVRVGKLGPMLFDGTWEALVEENKVKPINACQTGGFRLKSSAFIK